MIEWSSDPVIRIQQAAEQIRLVRPEDLHTIATWRATSCTLNGRYVEAAAWWQYAEEGAADSP